jgi:hypothetical protein
MQIHASSLGEAVPRGNFEALIQSTFESAANLRLLNEDRLLTVLISDHYELPQGIRIGTNSASLHSLTPGRRAAVRGGVLRFDFSPLTIDLRGAPVWKCPVSELDTDMRSNPSQQAWATAWRLLNEEQKVRNADIVADDLFRLHSGSFLSQRMSRSVMQLVTSAEQFDSPGSLFAAQGMIGLGPGVTPSGDDLLIGFLAGLWSTRRTDQGQLSFIDSFGDALQEAAKQTSEISRTYIVHAVRGQFSSSLANLAQAITTGHGLEQAVREAMQVGHSSGMDSVTGLLIGLAAWSAQSIHHPVPLP